MRKRLIGFIACFGVLALGLAACSTDPPPAPLADPPPDAVAGSGTHTEVVDDTAVFRFAVVNEGPLAPSNAVWRAVANELHRRGRTGEPYASYAVTDATSGTYAVTVATTTLDGSGAPSADQVQRAAEQLLTYVDTGVDKPVTPGAQGQDPADDPYSEASRGGFATILDDLRDHPARADWPRDRLDDLADRLDALFDAPGDDPIRLKAGDVRGVAAELRERESISPPYIGAVLGTLLDPDQDR